MDIKSVRLLGVVLCLQFVFGCNSNSPCPDIFDFECNGNKVYGKITVKPDEDNQPEFALKVKIRFTVVNQTGNKKGRLESLSPNASRMYNQGQAVNYRVYFPVIEPLPKVTAIVVNGDTICEGPGDISEPGQSSKEISLQHISFDNNYLDNPTAKNDCGIVDGGNDKIPLIHNGMYYERGQIPWLVAIYRAVENNLLFICGGTLVSDRHVVSAAHCMMRGGAKTPITEIVVKLGVHRLNDWSDDLTVTRKLMAATIHEEYNPETLQNDILMLTLIKRVPFNKYILPACLWSGDTELSGVVGATGVVAGWGGRSVEDIAIKPDEPQMVRIPIVSTIECRGSNSAFHQLTHNTTLCAGGRNGAGPCTGDSGSGFYLLEGGKWRLRGLVSLSIQNAALTCDLNEYVVFTDTAQFLPWILDILLEKYFKPENSLPNNVATSDTIECGIVPGSKKGSTLSLGTPYQLGEIPWIVGIIIRKKYEFPPTICSGTIISDRHVITAASCMTHLGKGTAFKDFMVNIGIYYDVDEFGAYINDSWELATVSLHEDYNPFTATNNIVILTLKKHLSIDQYVLPACLWSGDTKLSGVIGTSGYVSGLGVIKREEGTVAKFLSHVVGVPILDTENCTDYNFGFTVAAHDNTLCAGSLNETPCIGYDGASLYLQEGGMWRLRGIASASNGFVNEDGTCEHYAIYTDIAQFLPWIRKIMIETYFY